MMGESVLVWFAAATAIIPVAFFEWRRRATSACHPYKTRKIHETPGFVWQVWQVWYVIVPYHTMPYIHNVPYHPLYVLYIFLSLTHTCIIQYIHTPVRRSLRRYTMQQWRETEWSRIPSFILECRLLWILALQAFCDVLCSGYNVSRAIASKCGVQQSYVQYIARQQQRKEIGASRKVATPAQRATPTTQLFLPGNCNASCLLSSFFL